MDTRESQHTTSIRADQTVGSVLGGLAAAVYIQSVTGSVVVRPAAPPEPPDRITIKKYLEAAASQDLRPDSSKETEEVTQTLGKLWDTPFRARRAAGTESQALDEIVAQVLDDNRARGGYQRLVLLADAGMGKTPALKSLVAAVARQTVGDIDEPAIARPNIPIYVNLAHARTGQNLIATLSGAFNAYTSQKITDNQALGLLNTQKYTCFLFLDDLDQLLSQEEYGAFQSLCQLMETYHEHRFVVSCRTTANRRQLGSLDELYLDALSDEEVKDILSEREFKTLSQTSQKLSHNRCALEQYIRRGRSADLLETRGRFLDILIADRLKAIAGKLSDLDNDVALARGLLESLAIRMRLDRSHVYSERALMLVITGYLEEWRENIAWRKAISALADCELLRYDPKKSLWSFCDSCDEAYFAASALVNGRVQLAPLIPEASDIWWRDVFEILVGLHQDPQGLLLDLIDRDAFLAANYLQYVANPVRQTCQEALVDALVEEFWKESSARKTAIIEHLGQIEHPRAGQALLQILHREWSSMVLLAALEGLAVWGRGQVDAQKAICDAEESIFHSFGATVGRIGELLSWCWSDQIPDDWDWTPQIKFLRDRGKPLRARALVALGLGLKRIDGVDHELLQLLKARSTDEELAWCIVEALALLRPKQEIYDWAKKSARMKDRSSPLQRRRARAVYLLGLVGRDSETERLLRGALRDSQNPHVRGSAVMGMARLDLINARTEIEALMSSETNPWVLRQAAEALGQIGNLDTLPVLQKYLRSQQASNRRIVRRAINEILERNAMPPSLV